MKTKLLTIFLVSAFAPLIIFAQEIKKTDSQITVEANMAAQEAMWNEGRITDFMSLYWKSDSLEFIGSKGLTYGWQKTLDNYKKGYPDKKAMGILKFTILENKQLSENYIYIIGKWQLTKDKPAGGHFTLLWKKINNNWVIISDHTS